MVFSFGYALFIWVYTFFLRVPSSHSGTHTFLIWVPSFHLGMHTLFGLHHEVFHNHKNIAALNTLNNKNNDKL
ncbi:hypothetical protein GBAR_LOCUS28640 [Geodia barretti]|uniref:Uncharacterized protein n=1 Tax=Geodia barretti TaxID=519541 RepID=A0AA35XB97_GEOBA|nr:hypothetical protein GBAR_LOCUS28640 [Geodia barretti]